MEILSTSARAVLTFILATIAASGFLPTLEVKQRERTSRLDTHRSYSITILCGYMEEVS